MRIQKLIAMANSVLTAFGRTMRLFSSAFEKFLVAPHWIGITGILTFIAVVVTVLGLQSTRTTEAPNIDHVKTMPLPERPGAVPRSDSTPLISCVSSEQFRVLCEDAATNGSPAIISIALCSKMHITQIRISDANRNVYYVDQKATTFPLPPGNDDRSSKAEIFYFSVSDNRERVKSILVNKFGHCLL